MKPRIAIGPPKPIADRDRDRGERRDLIILLPVFNDWAALGQLLNLLDLSLVDGGLEADVLVADDGSTEPGDPAESGSPYQAIRRVDVLRLRRNLGHQRAIAVGLAFIEANRPRCRAVVVMDSDGEDRPGDVPRLVARCEAEGRRKIIFAERADRSEGVPFRIGYALYRLGYRALDRPSGPLRQLQRHPGDAAGLPGR